MNNRRDWLKKIGLGVAGLSLGQYEAIAKTLPDAIASYEDVTTVQLGLNENPYGPSPLARVKMADYINMNRYERRVISRLVTAIAEEHNIAKQNILMTAGSTEILDLVVKHAALQKGNFVSAEPTFNYWGKMAQKLGLNKITVPLTADKKHDLAAMLKAITPETRLVYVCNPNNPTGTICDPKELTSFIKEASKKTLVLVDEAYLEFTKLKSVSSYALDNENVVVAKTFSKIYGLAGARVGYAIANEKTIKKLGQLLTWKGGDISTISAAGAHASLHDKGFIQKVVTLNEKARNYTITELEKLNIKCIRSYTNFIYFSLVNYQKDFFVQLKKHNVLGTRIYEKEGQWSRISVGTMKEMELFINTLK